MPRQILDGSPLQVKSSRLIPLINSDVKFRWTTIWNSKKWYFFPLFRCLKVLKSKSFRSIKTMSKVDCILSGKRFTLPSGFLNSIESCCYRRKSHWLNSSSKHHINFKSKLSEENSHGSDNILKPQSRLWPFRSQLIVPYLKTPSSNLESPISKPNKQKTSSSNT